MAIKYPSRDELALKLFGRKFSQISTESKTQVVKMYEVIRNEVRSGGDSSSPIRQAVFKETVALVKQLKEIQSNPGDVIELPKGVLEDAARVIHYQSQAVGRGRILNPRDMAQIKKDIEKSFKVVDPRLVTGITDYLTNTTGKFGGVSPKILRSKLGSFLTSGELEALSNKELSTARDIVIAHLFDKWSGGNLTSFVGPKLNENYYRDIKKLEKSQTGRPVKSVSKEEVKQTLEAIDVLESLHANKSKLNSPIVQLALKRLGISPSDVVDNTVKEAVGELQHAVKGAASKSKRDSHTGLGATGLGGGLRRKQWSMKSLYRPREERISTHATIRARGIGKPTTVSSVMSGKTLKYDVPKMWAQDTDSTSYQNIIDELDWESSEQRVAAGDINFEKAYGNVMAPTKALGVLGIGSSPAPERMNELYTSLITGYAGSVTQKEADMPLSKHEREFYLDDILLHQAERKEYIDWCKDWLGDKWGGIWGTKLFEAGVPLGDATRIFRKNKNNRDRTAAIKWRLASNNEDALRMERPMGINSDEIKPMTVRGLLEKYYDAISGDRNVISGVKNFKRLSQGPDLMALPGMIESLKKEAFAGGVPGVKRVGIVGSKSWDNETFMKKYIGKNFSASDIMVSSWEVGKENGENFGAAYQASNAAFWQGILENKLKTRGVSKLNAAGLPILNKYGKPVKEDMTTKDVIDASDEVIAFFDEMYLSPSGQSQLTKIMDNIGDKKLRIVWVPTNLTKSKGSEAFGLKLMQLADKGNITIDKYHPGALPKGMSDKSFKMLAKGGSLKPGQNAVVGEAGPELLVSRPGGGFDVIPNKRLRYLAEGTLPLSSYARNVTGEKQPDEHDYIDPATGEIWPSVTKIKNMGKAYNGGSYYGNVGSVAHYYAAKALGAKHGIDTSHVTFPEVEAGDDLSGVYHSAEDIVKTGAEVARKWEKLADEMGFVPKMIEQRFVNTKEKYSGTLDIAGFVRDELGNLIPTIADFKSSSKVDKDFAEQIAAYADFFEDAVKGFVIHAKRDMSEFGVYEMDLTAGFAKWQNKLQKYNKKMGPRPLAGTIGTDAEDVAASRIFDLASRRMKIYDIEAREYRERQGIGVTTPGYARALSKSFPKFGAVGATPEETWDKNASRLAIFTARLEEMFGAMGGAGVHPTIKNVVSELKGAGWDEKSLAMLAGAPMGAVENDPATIKLFDRLYQSLKPIGFNQGLLSTGKNLDTMLWNDAIALLNILEEAGKSFESIPRFADKLKPTSAGILPTTLPGNADEVLSPVSVASSRRKGRKKKSAAVKVVEEGGWAFPWADEEMGKSFSKALPEEGAVHMEKGKPTVNLCEGTMRGFKVMISAAATAVAKACASASGGGGGKSKSKKSAPTATIPNIMNKGIWDFFEKMPIIGAPIGAHREMTQAKYEAETYDIRRGTIEGYNKAVINADIAQKKYYRSIRGATTSFLIAQHVLRVVGQGSQIVNKGSEAIGKGLGYILDMFLLPMLPMIQPVVKGMVTLGNAIRVFASPIWAFIGGVVIGKVIRGMYDMVSSFGSLPNTIQAAVNAINQLNLSISDLVRGAAVVPTGMPKEGPTPTPHQYNAPIGPAKPSLFTRAKKLLHFAEGSWYVPGDGGKDTTLARLTKGEMVLPVSVSKKIRGYANGGIAGMAGGVAGLVGSGFASFAGTDIGKDILGAAAGLGAVSRVIGATMAPVAPAMALGTMAGAGFDGVKNAVMRAVNIMQTVNEGGFSSVRTMTASLLMPLLTISAIALAIYSLLKSQPIMPTGIMPRFDLKDFKIPDIAKSILDKLNEIWERIKAKVRETWDSIKARALEIWEGIKARATEIWEKVKSKALGVWEKLKPVVDRVTSAFESLKKILEPTIERIKGLFEKLGIGEKTKGIVEKVTDKIFGAKEMKFSTVPGVGMTGGTTGPRTGGLVGAVGNAWSTAKTGISKLMGGGYLGTGALVGANQFFKGETSPIDLLTSIGPAMAGQWLFNKVGTKIAGFGGKAASIGGGLLGGAGGFLANPFFKEMGGNAENWMRRTLGMGESENAWGGRMIASTAGSLIGGLPGVVGAGLNDWWNNLGEVGGKLGTNQNPFITGTNQGLVGTAMKETWNLYGDIVQSLKGEYETGHSAIFDVFYQAGQDFKKGFGDIVTTLTGVPEMIMAGLATLSKDIKDAIINGVTGVGAGVIGVGQNALDKGMAAVTNTVDYAKKKAGFAYGGEVGSTGLAWVHKGENISPVGATTATVSNPKDTSVITLLSEIKAMLKQPTINQNTFEIKYENDELLMRKIEQRLAQKGSITGTQVTF